MWSWYIHNELRYFASWIMHAIKFGPVVQSRFLHLLFQVHFRIHCKVIRRNHGLIGVIVTTIWLIDESWCIVNSVSSEMLCGLWPICLIAGLYRSVEWMKFWQSKTTTNCTLLLIWWLWKIHLMAGWMAVYYYSFQSSSFYFATFWKLLEWRQGNCFCRGYKSYQILSPMIF